MGHLIMAEAHIENGQIPEAQQDLHKARALERRIDHKYVGDRRRFVEKRLPRDLPLVGLKEKDFDKAQSRLLGWFIENLSEKQSVYEVAKTLGMSRTRIRTYLRNLSNPENEAEPFRHLVGILYNAENRRNEKRSKR